MCGSENGKEGHYILYSISGLLRIRRGGIAAVFLTAGALFTQQVQQLAAALGAQAGVAAQQGRSKKSALPFSWARRSFRSRMKSS